MTQKIKNTAGYWRLALMIGLISKYFYDRNDLSLFHFYMYFYGASALTYLSTLTIWGEISEKALILRHGFLSLKKLKIQWENIELLKIQRILVKETDTGHGRFGGPWDPEAEYKVISIILKQPFYESIIENIKDIESNRFFTNRINIGKENNSIDVFSVPNGGFEFFLNNAVKYVNVEKNESINNKSTVRVLLAYFFNTMILLVAVYSFFWKVA